MSSIRVVVVCLALSVASVAGAEVKVYDVDFRYQQEVYAALSQVLVADPQVLSAEYGRVQLLPTGQILVDARPETHAQIEQVLAAIAARQAEVSPRARFRYWVVLGARGGDESERDSTPAVLSEVLGELERVHGDLAFRVFGTATLVTESGQEGFVEGSPLTVRQRAYVQGETASAMISMSCRITETIIRSGPPPEDGAVAFTTERRETSEQELELDVTLQRGEFLVLGENTIQTPGGIDGTLFYIVHWPTEE